MTRMNAVNIMGSVPLTPSLSPNGERGRVRGFKMLK
jgi:hypothetical protein